VLCTNCPSSYEVRMLEILGGMESTWQATQREVTGGCNACGLFSRRPCFDSSCCECDGHGSRVARSCCCVWWRAATEKQQSAVLNGHRAALVSDRCGRYILAHFTPSDSYTDRTRSLWYSLIVSLYIIHVYAARCKTFKTFLYPLLFYVCWCSCFIFHKSLSFLRFPR